MRTPDEEKAEIKLVEKELEDISKQLRKMREFVPAEPPFCSFCGKGKNQVEVMVQGPSAKICDECVALCGELIVAEKNQSS